MKMMYAARLRASGSNTGLREGIGTSVPPRSPRRRHQSCRPRNVSQVRPPLGRTWRFFTPAVSSLGSQSHHWIHTCYRTVAEPRASRLPRSCPAADSAQSAVVRVPRSQSETPNRTIRCELCQGPASMPLHHRSAAQPLQCIRRLLYCSAQRSAAEVRNFTKKIARAGVRGRADDAFCLTTPTVGGHMSTSLDAMRSGARDAQPAGSVLHMEMHAGERWRLTLFASSFLEWIKDESASSFARDVGTPASISVEEKEGDAQTTFHLTLTWSQFSTEELAHARAPRDTPASSLFTDAETPVFKQLTDLTMMMATVLERSQQHRRHSTRVRHVPD